QGTPEQKVDGQGARLGVMEPSTVGQAPKEHPTHNPAEDQQQPGYAEQAQVLATQAVEQAKALPGTVMAAVGMGGHKAEELPVREKKDDPLVDRLDGKAVEEFLRSKTMSAA
ncbi:hypothetical protein LTR53_013784, partial [Teratosphaeriaceae sp. CCFEE 6253]